MLLPEKTQIAAEYQNQETTFQICFITHDLEYLEIERFFFSNFCQLLIKAILEFQTQFMRLFDKNYLKKFLQKYEVVPDSSISWIQRQISEGIPGMFRRNLCKFIGNSSLGESLRYKSNVPRNLNEFLKESCANSLVKFLDFYINIQS